MCRSNQSLDFLALRPYMYNCLFVNTHLTKYAFLFSYHSTNAWCIHDNFNFVWSPVDIYCIRFTNKVQFTTCIRQEICLGFAIHFCMQLHSKKVFLINVISEHDTTNLFLFLLQINAGFKLKNLVLKYYFNSGLKKIITLRTLIFISYNFSHISYMPKRRTVWNSGF